MAQRGSVRTERTALLRTCRTVYSSTRRASYVCMVIETAVMQQFFGREILLIDEAPQLEPKNCLFGRQTTGEDDQ